MGDTKPKIIIDTDPGHDDALALLLLLKSKKIDVQAVTTVAGNASIDKVTRNAQAVINLTGANIPLFSGLPKPVKRALISAVVHGESGLDGFDTSKTEFKLTESAPEKIVEIVRKFPGEVTILTLGPLSNLARAFLLDPQLPSLVKRVVTMGGAITVPGNKNRVAEFNFFVDPEAAKIVFEAIVPKILVPLDVCNDVVLQVNDFNQIKNDHLQRILIPMMKHFFAGLAGDEGTNGILVYDALAAYFLINPQAYKFEPMNIIIETTGEFTSGMSVAERRKYKSEVPNINVAIKIDDIEFKKDLFKFLSRN